MIRSNKHTATGVSVLCGSSAFTDAADGSGVVVVAASAPAAGASASALTGSSAPPVASAGSGAAGSVVPLPSVPVLASFFIAGSSSSAPSSRFRLTFAGSCTEGARSRGLSSCWHGSLHELYNWVLTSSAGWMASATTSSSLPVMRPWSKSNTAALRAMLDRVFAAYPIEPYIKSSLGTDRFHPLLPAPRLVSTGFVISELAPRPVFGGIP